MPVMPDHWIRRMASEHAMIEPFVETQKREGVISYGLSSYGYDARVADEFRIFTNVDSRDRRSQGFSEASFVARRGPILHHPAEQLRARPHGRVFPHPARRAGDVPGQIDLRPLRHHRERHAARARVGGPRDARDLQHHAAAGAHLRQRGRRPDPVPPGRRALRDFATPTKPENTCASAASRCRNSDGRWIASASAAAARSMARSSSAAPRTRPCR